MRCFCHRTSMFKLPQCQEPRVPFYSVKTNKVRLLHIAPPGTPYVKEFTNRVNRGSTGRFIAPIGSEESPQARRVEPGVATSPAQQPSSKQSDVSTARTARNPQFSLNLDELYEDGGPAVTDEAIGGETTTAKNTAPVANVARTRNRSTSRPAFVGESWFASFLAHNVATGHMDILPNGANRTRSTSPRTEAEGPMDANPNTAAMPLVNSGLPEDLPPKHLRHRLIEAFFARFHVYLPILDKPSFASSVEDGSVSITLLRSVLFVGSTQCDPEVYHLLGFSTRNDAGDELFGLAKSSFDSDSTSDRTAMLQSCFLLHYWWGQPTAFKDSLWWLSAAIRSAQCMGMHRSTGKSTISRDIQILWKRIWWCLYVSDVLDRFTHLSS